ncbi:LPS assembly lipoprotein LptE [Hyphococcus luteus]|uniref:LPS-assembly lipoprotein n=1 Tax=Hyphococcus luteus TaxID=2058213 RepID=A0A2S7K6P1_9PROT|nr:LPS assembly lipoprotein LptE [Marinicaulis flavus]PQA88180.1 hypothetical protein CW354_07670 [Marinicaulis flavus]
MKRTAILVAITASALLLSGCGFRPLYATAEGETPVSRLVAVRTVAAPDIVAPYIVEALHGRMGAVGDETPRYDLYVEANEQAQRLAVQIDATVTRYNYRLSARYRVVDSVTGERFEGSARAVTSYNIVSSQYSTLFAERTAIEKAARLLAEEIERDLLIQFDQTPEERAKSKGRDYETDLDPSEILNEPRRGETVEPIVGDDGFDGPIVIENKEDE